MSTIEHPDLVAREAWNHNARFWDERLTSIRLAELGANLVAIDFAEELVELARQKRGHSSVEYRVIDATDYDALLALGAGAFDGALCNMALMDLADIQPLMKALTRLLRPNSHFVFSVVHSCFNNPATVQMSELEDREGTFETVYSVKTSRYLTPFTLLGAAMHGQPTLHPYFHRPLSVLLGAGLEAGMAAPDAPQCRGQIDVGYWQRTLSGSKHA